ncbi:WSC domain-containing protein [Stagonosporopsis vannaccii]|nr:WSC domain-containing protein [Stagonosporopsis vannaccii]
MRLSTLATAQIGLLNVLPAAAEYVWPSKHDRMEDLLVLQGGYIREGFIDGISPCTRNPNSPGRQTAAEWIRTAFHDMATFDKATGVGGLDASIQFETDRAENAGDAFNGTFGFTNNYYSIRTSAADLIALSTVLAVGNCGGPKIPLRIGRVDATEGGVLGVPEPQQDLDTHKKMFAKAGFSTEDMIAMVACGHTMGGVHGKTFPEITENNEESNVVHFDSTDATFDPKVATEYLDGTTQNPLVVAHNDTLNSDKRIFAADNNITMKALASDPKTFQSMCSDIFARMIDTVPSTVTLTEPLEPIPLKPYIESFALTNASHVTLNGRIRLLTTSDKYDDERVTITYTPRFAPAANATLNTTILTTPANFKLGTSSGIFGELFKWHEFSVALPTSTSIESFNVTVTRVSTGEQTFYDNAGRGYPLDDNVLYQDAQSCRIDNDATIVAAVRKSVVDAGTPVIVSMARKYAKQGTMVPAFEIEKWEGKLGKEIGEYVLVTMKGVQQPESYSTHFDIVAGESMVEYQNTNVLGQKVCEEM